MPDIERSVLDVVADRVVATGVACSEGDLMHVLQYGYPEDQVHEALEKLTAVPPKLGMFLGNAGPEYTLTLDGWLASKHVVKVQGVIGVAMRLLRRFEGPEFSVTTLEWSYLAAEGKFSSHDYPLVRSVLVAAGLCEGVAMETPWREGQQVQAFFRFPLDRSEIARLVDVNDFIRYRRKTPPQLVYLRKRLARELTPDRRFVLRNTYEYFRRQGDWPKCRDMESKLLGAGRRSLSEIGRDTSLFWSGNPLDDREQIRLTLAGLLHCADSGEDQQLVVQLLSAAGKLARAQPALRSIALTALAQQAGSFQYDISSLLAFTKLINSESEAYFLSSGPDITDYALAISPRLIKFADATRLEDILLGIYKDECPSAAAPLEGETIGPNSPQVTLDIDSLPHATTHEKERNELLTHHKLAGGEPSMTSRLYDELLGHVRNNRVLFVVGTGVSLGATRGASHASWTGLIKDGLTYCAEIDPKLPEDWAAIKSKNLDDAMNRGDLFELIAIATMVEQRLAGRKRQGGAWRNWLRETIGKLKVLDDSLVKVLRSLGRGRLATCNYDDVLTSSEQPAVPWTNISDVVRVLNGQDKGVVHLHGHWKTPESIVLGYGAYSSVLSSEAAQSLQRALVSLSSLVFVGFGAGLEDPNVGALLEWMGETFSEREAHHFWLVRKDELQRTSKSLHEKRIAVLSYGPTHADLEKFLRRLAEDAGILVNSKSELTMLPQAARAYGNTSAKKDEIEPLSEHNIIPQRRPLISLFYDSRGWCIQNMGDAPATQAVVFIRKTENSTWEQPVRVAALSNGDVRVLAWLGHANMHGLGVLYHDLNNRIYSTTCHHDANKHSDGSVFPEFIDAEIAREWEL